MSILFQVTCHPVAILTQHLEYGFKMLLAIVGKLYEHTFSKSFASCLKPAIHFLNRQMNASQEAICEFQFHYIRISICSHIYKRTHNI